MQQKKKNIFISCTVLEEKCHDISQQAAFFQEGNFLKQENCHEKKQGLDYLKFKDC